MNDAEKLVLHTLYQIEEEKLQKGNYDEWVTADIIANHLPSSCSKYADTHWVRQQLDSLWKSRKILQVPDQINSEDYELHDIELKDLDTFGIDGAKLKNEDDDIRSGKRGDFEQVAFYSKNVNTKYRSRVAEVTRLLSRNYQRFNMAPSTGLLRYQRFPQCRPRRDINIKDFTKALCQNIKQGHFVLKKDFSEYNYKIDSKIETEVLIKASSNVLEVIEEHLGESEMLSSFQIDSIIATLCGLYSKEFRKENSAHVITAGVGSGKSFAFQIGAIIHITYAKLKSQTGIKVLLLYPRVALAANQFKDLNEIVEAVNTKLDIKLQLPLLDAGGQIKQQMGFDANTIGGGLYKSIIKGYSGDYGLLISNLDTIANRIVHPDACEGLTKNIDLIIIDEIHLLSGLYGAHAKMLIKRIEALRSLWRLREHNPNASFENLLSAFSKIEPPYYIGASATIAEPNEHTGKIISKDAIAVRHIDVDDAEETGWVHHLFIRQRPETSNITALVNATSCLIHNRSNGLFRDYYTLSNPSPNEHISLNLLGNPISSNLKVKLLETPYIHKTIGFSDSLDNVGRWTDLVSDNEKTKTNEMHSNPRLLVSSFPYFLRFQEPLWRVVHHSSFSSTPLQWRIKIREYYGNLCLNCKKGILSSIKRVPDHLSSVQRKNVEELWNFDRNGSYLPLLGVKPEFINSNWFAPCHRVATSEFLTNLDQCAFFVTGLCWWWSSDHAGSNVPQNVGHNSPLNGFRKPGLNSNEYYHVVNGIRVSSFTSNTDFSVMALDSINDVFRGKANKLFRDIHFNNEHEENSSLIIGSPRLEVGIDLSRVRDGITFQAMRDPASLQQKVGRVGREKASDSMVVHIITQNTRDQYYFRNPNIVLDSDYLQPVPMHEDNRIVANQHYFMAIVDFLCLQGSNPGVGRISKWGERLNLINDHQNSKSFSGWDQKIESVYSYLFDNHPLQETNLSNLKKYLGLLGASSKEISIPSEGKTLSPVDAPLSINVGVIDVFKHEFGPNFFLTKVPVRGKMITLASICSESRPINPLPVIENLPRQEGFIKTYNISPTGGPPKPKRDRSYLWNLMQLSLFRRGIPNKNIPGNQPYVWAPNLFETVGNEIVRVFEEIDARQHELGYVTVSMAIALLLPGTVTYRYRISPRKVPVSTLSCQGSPEDYAERTQAVFLRTEDPEYFELASNCQELERGDLPDNFIGSLPVKVYTPRQIGVIRSSSEPYVKLPEGMMADDDSRPFNPESSMQIMAPPKSFSLRWFRVKAFDLKKIPCRFKTNYSVYSKLQISELPKPRVFTMFDKIEYNSALDITEFAWGLDRQFPTRRVEAARLIYQNFSNESVALGHRYQAPGLVFSLGLKENDKFDLFFKELINQTSSGSHQSLLVQVLYRFLNDFAKNPLPPDAPAWEEPTRASIFSIKDLRTILLFHLLELWHPLPQEEKTPSSHFVLNLENISGCFTEGHENYIDSLGYNRICERIARTRGVSDEHQHHETLLRTYPNFQEACEHASELTTEYMRKTAFDILTNSIAIALHNAALRLTGAEDEQLLYFYKIDDEKVKIYLFDRDAFGNGTSELIKKYLFISNSERAIRDKLKVLGNNVDPLPTKDFAWCFEEELQECENSQAAQLAFSNKPADNKCFEKLLNIAKSETQNAGRLFDFLKNEFALSSFDHLIPFQSCPEFIAHVTSVYKCYETKKILGTPEYPVYQSLESAIGFCSYGCVSCIVTPEKNITGSLNAKEVVNAILLNDFFRSQICEADDELTNLCYPGSGLARTIEWHKRSMLENENRGKEIPFDPIILNFPYPHSKDIQSLTIIPAMNVAEWKRVFRVDWEPVSEPKPIVRLRMMY